MCLFIYDLFTDKLISKVIILICFQDDEDHLGLNLELIKANEILRNGHMLSGGDVLRKMIFTRSIDRLNTIDVLNSLDLLSDGTVSHALKRIKGKPKAISMN